MPLKSRITGTGSYVPSTVIANAALEKKIDTSDEWIVERTGIRERRVAGDTQAASDLGVKAAKQAMKDAGVKPGDIDMVVVATMSGDMPMPSTASIMQHKLGIHNAGAFDINAACSGFVYALSVADSMVRSGSSGKLLLVGVEVNSKFLDWKDRGTCVLFGDGAGAVVLEPTKGESGILSTRLFSDGSMWDYVCLPGGGSKHPPSEDTLRKGLHYIKMKGNETFKVAVRTLEKLVVETLK